jgi:hypothetical protein
VLYADFIGAELVDVFEQVVCYMLDISRMNTVDKHGSRRFGGNGQRGERTNKVSKQVRTRTAGIIGTTGIGGDRNLVPPVPVPLHYAVPRPSWPSTAAAKPAKRDYSPATNLRRTAELTNAGWGYWSVKQMESVPLPSFSVVNLNETVWEGWVCEWLVDCGGGGGGGGEVRRWF